MHFEEDSRPRNYEVFQFTIPALTIKQDQLLEIPIEIPYPGLITEFTQRLITNFTLPFYIEDGKNEPINSGKVLLFLIYI